jgi:hypothetical protein
MTSSEIESWKIMAILTTPVRASHIWRVLGTSQLLLSLGKCRCFLAVLVTVTEKTLPYLSLQKSIYLALILPRLPWPSSAQLSYPNLVEYILGSLKFTCAEDCSSEGPLTGYQRMWSMQGTSKFQKICLLNGLFLKPSFLLIYIEFF